MSFVRGAGEPCSGHSAACAAFSELLFLPLQTGGTRRSRPPPQAGRQNVGWHTAKRAGLESGRSGPKIQRILHLDQMVEKKTRSE